jgi:CarD family transcriptional regulator
MVQKKKIAGKPEVAKVQTSKKPAPAKVAAKQPVLAKSVPAPSAKKPAAAAKPAAVAARAASAPAKKAVAPVAKVAAKPTQPVAKVAAKPVAVAKAPARAEAPKVPAAAKAPGKPLVAAQPVKPAAQAAKPMAEAVKPAAPVVKPAAASPLNGSASLKPQVAAFQAARAANVQHLPKAMPALNVGKSVVTPKIAGPMAAAPATPKDIAQKTAAQAQRVAVPEGPKKPVSQRHGFKTNEWIVYPSHGVGRIIAIEEQEIAGMALELFVIQFEKDKMTLRVPTGKSQSVGMRKLAEDGIVKRAMETLKGKARIKRTMWSRRAQEFEAKINSGDLVAIAEVVRDLYRAENQPEQSYSERQLYEAALDRMAREIAAVDKLDERGAVQRITEVLSKSAKSRRPAGEEAAPAAAEGDEEIKAA